MGGGGAAETPSGGEAAAKPSAAAEVEVERGTVLWLVPSVLVEDPRACNTQDPPVLRKGPFVCIEREGEMTTWIGITSRQRRQDRVELRAEWRLGGGRRWREGQQFLTDGASVWRGPLESFLAARSEDLVARGDPARLSAEGVAAARLEVMLQRGRRHRSCGDSGG